MELLDSTPDSSASDFGEQRFENFAKFDLLAWERNPGNVSLRERAGLALLGCGRAARAVEVLGEPREPRSFWLDFYLSLALQKIGRTQEAILRLRGLTERFSEDWRPWHALGRLLLHTGDFDDARPILEQALLRRPASAAVLNDLAVATLADAKDNKTVHQALGFLRRAIRSDERFLPALNNLAACYQRLGRPEAAIRALHRALVVCPVCLPATRNLAQAYIDSNRFQDAIRLLERHAIEQPHDVDGKERLAWAYGSIGNHAKATQVLAECVDQTKARVPALLNNLAIALMARDKQLDRAASLFEKAIRIAPKDAIYRVNYAFLLSRQHDWAGVLAVLPENVTRNGSVDAAVLRSEALYRTEMWGEADEQLAEALRAVGPDPRLFALRGLVLVSYLGRAEEAVGILEEARKVFPDNLAIANNLAYAHIKLGQLPAARRLLEEVTVANADRRQAVLLATWGLLLIREGSFDEGIARYRQAQALARDELAVRIRQKIAVEQGRHLLERDDRQAARKLLGVAIEGDDPEFREEARALLLFCGVAGKA